MNIKIDLYLIISLIILLLFKQIEIFVCFYVFVTLHEFAHIIMAMILGIKVEEISFLPCGVNAKFDFRNHKVKEIIISSAGPIFSMIMAYIFKDFKVQNLFICLSNLIPIYPLDGGRILKNIMLLLLKNNGLKIYNNLLISFTIIFLILNIIFIIFFKSYQFIFVSLYIFQLANEEIKNDKVKMKIMSILNE